jgi:hypothetical protein
MEKNLQAPQVLISAHAMKSIVFPVVKVELARVLGGTGPLNNMH